MKRMTCGELHRTIDVQRRPKSHKDLTTADVERWAASNNFGLNAIAVLALTGALQTRFWQGKVLRWVRENPIA